jgi:hypothetical protein
VAHGSALYHKTIAQRTAGRMINSVFSMRNPCLRFYLSPRLSNWAKIPMLASASAQGAKSQGWPISAYVLGSHSNFAGY